MKKIIVSALLLCSAVTFAQEEKTESNWTKGGVFTLLFNQASFNDDWQGGGVNNLSSNASINYDINYKKDNVVWDNKFILAYGLTKTDASNKYIKSDDRIDISSLWGKQAVNNWYYSAYGKFNSQFADGFSDAKQPAESLISTTLSPAYLQAGPGMLYKKSDNFKVNITPASARLIYVDEQFTIDNSAFGVEQGETSRFEFGANLSAYYKAEILKNVTIENTLNLYMNYVEDLGNTDVDYTLTINMKINEYLSGNFGVQALYDDNAVKAIQLRQVFGLGFNYKLK